MSDLTLIVLVALAGVAGIIGAIWWFSHQHDWTPWEDECVIDYWDSTFGPAKYPSKQKLLQQRRCRDCNKLRARRIRL